MHILEKAENDIKEQFELEMKGKKQKEKKDNENSIKKIFFNEKNVHILSKDILNKYKYGIYKDNALSFLIR